MLMLDEEQIWSNWAGVAILTCSKSVGHLVCKVTKLFKYIQYIATTKSTYNPLQNVPELYMNCCMNLNNVTTYIVCDYNRRNLPITNMCLRELEYKAHLYSIFILHIHTFILPIPTITASLIILQTMLLCFRNVDVICWLFQNATSFHSFPYNISIN